MAPVLRMAMAALVCLVAADAGGHRSRPRVDSTEMLIAGVLATDPPRFDAVSAFGIGGLAIAVAVLWVVLVTRRERWRGLAYGLAVAVVMAVSGLAAELGYLARFDLAPPPMAVLIPGILIASFALGLSGVGRRMAAEVPLPALIGLQAFRLPLELVMHHAAAIGIMPPELSYSGYNYDIVTGAGAALLFLLFRIGVRVPTALVWLWNLWGCVALAAIAGIAMASSPMVRAFGDDPRHVNTWVLYFPYIWLPVVLVTIAISSHIVITRQLLAGGPVSPR